MHVSWPFVFITSLLGGVGISLLSFRFWDALENLVQRFPCLDGFWSGLIISALIYAVFIFTFFDLIPGQRLAWALCLVGASIATSIFVVSDDSIFRVMRRHQPN